MNKDLEKYQNRGWWRAKCRNLFWFCSVVLADCWKEEFQDFGCLQEDMCNFLSNEKSFKKLMSVSRWSLKTTVLLGFCIWKVCLALMDDKAESIAYNTATKDNSAQFYDKFKYTVLNNKLLLWIFPELPRTESEYTTFSKKKISFHYVSIEFSSLEEQQVSRHQKIIINDDLVNDKNSETETGRNSIKRSWRYQKSLLTKIRKRKIGLEIDVGTPYHYQDLMWELIDRNKSYDKFIRACIEGWPDVTIADVKERRKPLTFPEIKTYEDLLDTLEDQRETIFSSQQLIKPLSEEGALCREGWLRYFTIPPDNYYRTMVIDPGGSDPDVHDATGITIVDTDENGKWFIQYAEELWLTPLDLIDTIKSLIDEYKPDDTRIEKEKYSITIADQFEHRFPELNISFAEHKKKDKRFRIWRLRQWFQSKRIFIKAEQSTLIEQLLTYPQTGIRDDILDSLAYHIDIRIVPQKQQAPRFVPNIESTFEKEMREFMEGIERRDEEEINFNDSIY